jgi:Flp pilus assembly protein TadG
MMGVMENRSGNPGAAEGTRCAEIFARRFARLHHLAKRVLGDRRGNVAITFCVALTVIIGAVGLGTDAASWYATKRAMQNAADIAAEGAINSLKSYYPCSATCTTKAGYAKSEGKSAAALRGFTNGTGGTTVSIQVKGVDSPIYTSANYTGAVDYGAAEAVVTQPGKFLFSSLFMTGTPTLVARAVTKLNISTGDCMMSLNKTAAKAFTTQGSVNINVPCGLADASCDADAFDVTGGSTTIVTTGLRVCGGTANVPSNVSVTTGDHSITDPYASRTLPTLGTGYPNGSTWPSNKLQTASPAYTYTPPGGTITSSINSTTMFPSGCNSGCTINGSVGAATGNSKFSGTSSSPATLTLGEGVYFVTGSIWLGSNSKIVSSGATIILTNATAASIGTFTMDSNATASMSPPSSTTGQPGNGALTTFPGVAGIAMMQDPRASESTLKSNGACNTNCSTLQGGPSDSLTGAVYFPNGNLTWQGNGNTTNCFQMIADTLTLAGNPGVSVSNCSDGENTFGPTTVAMVE